MRFQVPQFIEVESKIFGPLTFKQFVYLAGGAGLIFLLHIMLPFFLTVVFAVPVGAFAVALAFFKIHNRPFIIVAENAVRYYMAPKIFIWKKEKPKPVEFSLERTIRPEGVAPYIPKLTQNKLKDLAWSLDIKHNIR